MQKRSALVIGASSPGGLGEASARRLAADGFAVTVSGRNARRLDSLAQEIGGQARVCDVLDEESIAAAATAVGTLDVLVNTAGTTMGRSIVNISRAEIEAQLAMHVTANILLLKHFGPRMPRGGSIILFSSVVSQRAGAGLVAYSAAKAALDHVVRVAALEFGPLGIRVNAIAPGFVHTPMTDAFLGDDRLRTLYERETALGALTQPGQVAAAVAYLAAADCYATGEITQVSGGAQLCRLPRKSELKG
ncbi:SDR family NAD(P)-dependent oxidoreductase [Sphingomonas flavalba]|uniref:SDR family NAD(P)-dependent oxidoreductase n=1 Tax=Sphingomonas flavalba TaxID=2559804 RepID=UPI0014460B53|nr:SDR family oxidoreductase [Sphingomonas flavalba]